MDIQNFHLYLKLPQLQLRNKLQRIDATSVRYWEFQDIGDSLKWYRVNPHLDLISNEELGAYQSEYPLRVLLNPHDLRDY